MSFGGEIWRSGCGSRKQQMEPRNRSGGARFSPIEVEGRTEGSVADVRILIEYSVPRVRNRGALQAVETAELSEHRVERCANTFADYFHETCCSHCHPPLPIPATLPLRPIRSHRQKQTLPSSLTATSSLSFRRSELRKSAWEGTAVEWHTFGRASTRDAGVGPTRDTRRPGATVVH